MIEKDKLKARYHTKGEKHWNKQSCMQLIFQLLVASYKLSYEANINHSNAIPLCSVESWCDPSAPCFFTIRKLSLGEHGKSYSKIIMLLGVVELIQACPSQYIVFWLVYEVLNDLWYAMHTSITYWTCSVLFGRTTKKQNIITGCK